MSCKKEKYPYEWTEGDTQPPITGVIPDTDITGYTVEFRMERPDGSAPLTLSTATTGVAITNAAAGQFSITFVATDLVAGKDQICQVRYIDGSGNPTTGPDFTIDVKDLKGA